MVVTNIKNVNQEKQGATYRLRPYQENAVAELLESVLEGDIHPVVSIPTGGGKSIVQADLIRRYLNLFPEARILCLAHRQELLAQNAEKIQALNPGRTVGIFCGGLNRKESGAKVVVGAIDSVYRAKFVGSIRFDLIIIDECHRVPHRGDLGVYNTTLNQQPQATLVGLSATPYRTKEGSLVEGEDARFNRLIVGADIQELIDDGYLSPLRSNVGSEDLAPELNRMRRQAGDFSPKSLSALMSDDDRVMANCLQIAGVCKDRQKILVFCCNVDHAHKVADQLNALGIGSRVISGETPNDERQTVLESFSKGPLRCVVNVDVLTTGFDAPSIDCIALIRPTLSPVLYVQCVGRGSRVAGGKTDCLVLDFGGNIARFGPIDCIEVGADGAPKLAPTRPCRAEGCSTLCKVGDHQCRSCGSCLDCLTVHNLRALRCRKCNRCFKCWKAAWACACRQKTKRRQDGAASERQYGNLTAVASSESILSKGNPGRRWIQVDDISIRKHFSKKKAKFLMRIDLSFQGRRVAQSYLCFDHGGYAARKAKDKWVLFAGTPAPESVQEAIKRAGEIRTPTHVTIDRSKEWSDVISVKNEAGPGAAHTNSHPTPFMPKPHQESR